jgi:hypothetical protein
MSKTMLAHDSLVYLTPAPRLVVAVDVCSWICEMDDVIFLLLLCLSSILPLLHSLSQQSVLVEQMLDGFGYGGVLACCSYLLLLVSMSS